VRTPTLLLALSLLLPPLTAAPVVAQDGFLFRPPLVTLALRAAHSAPRANGEVFDFMTDELTLERGDFAAPGFGVDVGLFVHDRFDLVLGVSRVQSVQRSEFREYVGEDDLPIEQTTKLLRVPATLSARFYPLARGRNLASHAWIPARLVPWVQAGGGMQWYRLTQEGDFVDHETLDIFADELRASGSSLVAHAGAGLDYWVATRTGVSVEGGYSWGSAELDDSFQNFDDIDLRGFQASVGIVFRF
jgi:hypothetical protein